MDQLNNWDEDTINHLIHKLQIDAETARNLKDNYNLKAVNTRIEDFGKERGYRQLAFEQYGRESSCYYFIAYLREMLADNAEAIEAHQPS